MLVRRPGIALIAVLIAGCGGGGSDGTAVSASPEAPPAVVPGPAPTPSPGAAPAPSPGGTPAPSPGTSPTPGAAPTPTGESVSGQLVWAALQKGVSPDPAPTNPYTDFRRVSMEGGGDYFLGDALAGHSLAQSSWGPIVVSDLLKISAISNNGVIVGVNANGMTLEGAQLDLRNVNPEIDGVAGTWTNGQWFAKLVVQSDKPDLVKVCWDAYLPAPPPVNGPPGSEPVVRPVPFKRLTCGIYSKKQVGPDVGGYIADDFGGTVRTFRGDW